jgi:hypothetical protein
MALNASNLISIVFQGNARINSGINDVDASIPFDSEEMRHISGRCNEVGRNVFFGVVESSLSEKRRDALL